MNLRLILKLVPGMQNASHHISAGVVGMRDERAVGYGLRRNRQLSGVAI